MPFYDYHCQDCRGVFTIERSMSDSTEPVCTSCGSESTTRIWNAFVISGGSTPDVGQGMSQGSRKKSGCGSCTGHACGTCH